MDERLRVVIDDAIRAIDRQATRLDELRQRAGTFITAGSVVGSFLGAPAVAGDRRLATFVGAAAFLVLLSQVGFVLWPHSGWRFARPGHLTLASYDRDDLADADAFARAYADDLGRDYQENDQALGPRAAAISIAVWALAVEAAALLYAAAAA